MKDRGRFKWSFWGSTPHYPTVQCVCTGLVHMCDGTRQLIGIVEGRLGRNRNHFMHNNFCTDIIRVTAGIVVEGLVVHAALWSAGCIVCLLTEGGATSLGGLTIHVDKQHDGRIAFEASLLSLLPIVGSKNRSMESNEGWNERESHWKRGLEDKKRKKGRNWER